MCDTETRLRLRNYRLRCDAAGPKYGQLICVNLYSITVIWSAEIFDTDGFWQADVDWRTMNRRKSRGDLYCTDRIGRFERSHRNNQWPIEHTRTGAGSICPIHRDVQSESDMANFDAVLNQCLFEGK